MQFLMCQLYIATIVRGKCTTQIVLINKSILAKKMRKCELPNEVQYQHFPIPPKIEKVTATDWYCLIVTFDNGVIKQYDMQNRIEKYRFDCLIGLDYFKDVKVQKDGMGVRWDSEDYLSWDSQINLSVFELWHFGTDKVPYTNE